MYTMGLGMFAEMAKWPLPSWRSAIDLLTTATIPVAEN